jgi:undecaprenyl-diphosphatase
VSVWQAIVLGIVQGLTEFLPVSSSAHLVIVPWLLGWASPGLAFDAALHLGTLTAVLFYFWRDLLAMAVALPRALRRPAAVLTSRNPNDTMPRLALLIAIGTVPGLVVGYIGQEAIEERYYPAGVTPDRIIVAIAVALIVLALILLWAERAARHVRRLDDLTVADGIVIGVAQVAALVPGISRAGATITAGLFRGLARADAARFSFLLGTPIVAAAGAKGLLDTVTGGLDATQLGIFAVGLATSALAGFTAIWWLLRYLQRASTLVFIVYRIVVGIVLLGLVFAR